MATIEKRTRGTVTKYRVKVRLKGHPPVDATFDRKTDASRWASATEAAIREGRWFRDAQARRITLAELIDRYRVEHLGSSNARTRGQRAKRLEFWRAELGAYALVDVTPDRINEARSRLQDAAGRQLAPATANQYVGDLRHVFNVARRDFAIAIANPVAELTKLKEPRGRVRFLSAAERSALLREVANHSPDLYCITVAALSTGARKGELLNLRVADVDLRRGLLQFDQTKNGERRSVPLVGLALDLIAERLKVRRLDSTLLFPGAKGAPLAIDKAFRAACQRAGIVGFRFHDLRHSAASELAMGGATLAEIAEVLGHKTLQMVRRYTHLTEGHTRAVVERMSARVFA